MYADFLNRYVKKLLPDDRKHRLAPEHGAECSHKPNVKFWEQTFHIHVQHCVSPIISYNCASVRIVYYPF